MFTNAKSLNLDVAYDFRRILTKMEIDRVQNKL